MTDTSSQVKWRAKGSESTLPCMLQKRPRDLGTLGAVDDDHIQKPVPDIRRRAHGDAPAELLPVAQRRDEHLLFDDLFPRTDGQLHAVVLHEGGERAGKVLALVVEALHPLAAEEDIGVDAHARDVEAAPPVRKVDVIGGLGRAL